MGWAKAWAVVATLGCASFCATARADDRVRAHAFAGGSKALGSPQQDETGLGGMISFRGGFAVTQPLLLELGVGLMHLTAGSRPEDPRFAERQGATAVTATGGVRLEPMPLKHGGGWWLGLAGGAAFSGDLVRPAGEAQLGYDFRLGKGRIDMGPFAQYTHIVQPDDTLRPEDARVVSLGIAFGIGREVPPPPAPPRADRDKDGVFDDEDACPREPGLRTGDPSTNGCPRRDRDGDAVYDDEDACRDTPGYRTADPQTNGCPRSDRDKDTIFDEEDACPDKAGVPSTDPKQHGCPRPDRDNDKVFDDEDACIDVPGIRTSDPKTNGCPESATGIRVEGDKIILDDIIHFDNNSPRVRSVSFAIVRKVAELMRSNPDILEVDIEGHADQIGTTEHNLQLSWARADSVKKLLVRFGVDADRITTHAYGKARPRALGTAEEQRKMNRRVEFTITRVRPAKEKER